MKVGKALIPGVFLLGMAVGSGLHAVMMNEASSSAGAELDRLAVDAMSSAERYAGRVGDLDSGRDARVRRVLLGWARTDLYLVEGYLQASPSRNAASVLEPRAAALAERLGVLD